MKKLEWKIGYMEVDNELELSEKDKQLLIKARMAANNAYAPYSQFNVGAAALLKNGEIIIGNNQENIAYPSGLCAERVAVFTAGAHHPSVAIDTIAITCKTDKFEMNEPITPCGDCRQVLLEYEMRHNNKIRLILMGERGKVRILDSVADLMPFAFTAKGLSK